jgi:tetratricopeptide (TPR) repeat protein
MVGMNPQSADGYIQVARAALAIDHYPKAHVAITAGLREHPDHVGLLILMSQRHLAVGHPHGALAPAERAAVLAPTNAHVLQNLAMVLRASGKNRKAQEILKQIYELDPDAGPTFAMAAYDAFAQHRFNDAMPLAQRALEGDPENQLARYVLARCRIYRNPLMRPYWFLARQNTALVCVLALVAMVGMGYAGRGIGGMLIGAVFIYALLCMMVALWVDRDRGPDADKPPKVTLKDY